MYSNYRDVLIIEKKDGSRFNIPFYSKSKMASQCLSFIITGSIVEYSFSLLRYVYADRRFIPANKGDFICSNNKRKNVNGQKNNIAYSSYVFNNLKSGEDYSTIEVKFCFTEYSLMQILEHYINTSAKKALVSAKHFIKDKDTQEWIEIQLDSLPTEYEEFKNNSIENKTE